MMMAAPSSIPPFPDEGGGSASNIPPFPDEAAPSPKPPSLGTKPGATFTIQHPLPERAERPEAKDLILRELTDIPKSLLSLADMVGSIPASLVGAAVASGVAGAVSCGDRRSMVEAARAGAGGKGMEAGVRKLARGKATDATLAGAKLNAEALERIQRMKVQKSPDPTAPAKVAEAKVGVAQE